MHLKSSMEKTTGVTFLRNGKIKVSSFPPMFDVEYLASSVHFLRFVAFSRHFKLIEVCEILFVFIILTLN